MTDVSKAAPRRWIFEPHNGYGSSDPEVNPWPFGYLTRTEPLDPIFELGDVGLRRKPGELRAFADLIVQALNERNDLITALKTAQQAFMAINLAETNPNWFTHGARAAIAHSYAWRNRGHQAVDAALSRVSAVTVENAGGEDARSLVQHGTSDYLNWPVMSATDRALDIATKALEAIAIQGVERDAANDALADIRILVPRLG